MCSGWNLQYKNIQNTRGVNIHTNIGRTTISSSGKVLDHGNLTCVKSVQIRSYFWSVFSCIRTEYRDLLGKSPCLVRLQENTD